MTTTASLLAAAIDDIRRGTSSIVYGVATAKNTVQVAGADTAVELPALDPVFAGDYCAILVSGADRLIVGAVGRALASYTPGTTITVGTGGTSVGSFLVVGGLMFAQGIVTLGTAGFSVTSPVSVGLPTGYEFSNTADTPVGRVRFVNPGDWGYPGELRVANSTSAQAFAYNAAGTYLRDDNASSTVPFTWGASDRLHWSLVAPVE